MCIEFEHHDESAFKVIVKELSGDDHVLKYYDPACKLPQV